MSRGDEPFHISTTLCSVSIFLILLCRHLEGADLLPLYNCMFTSSNIISRSKEEIQYNLTIEICLVSNKKGACPNDRKYLNVLFLSLVACLKRKLVQIFCLFGNSLLRNLPSGFIIETDSPLMCFIF